MHSDYPILRRLHVAPHHEVIMVDVGSKARSAVAAQALKWRRAARRAFRKV